MCKKNLNRVILGSVAMLLATGVSAQMHVDALGDVGVGTMSPSTSLHVLRNDGSASILIEETDAVVAARTLFQLVNNGNTKFGVLNNTANVEWAFANPGTGFRLSLQGSGAVEMEILNNGNMIIAGALTQNSDVNVKTAITEVNSTKLLDVLSQLPISQWEYKDAVGEKHIGPMAQDFYAAFGLGATKTGISTIDTAGVALVAIKELIRINQEQSQVITDLTTSHRQLLTAYHIQAEKNEKLDMLEQVVNQLIQSQEGKTVYTSLK